MEIDLKNNKYLEKKDIFIATNGNPCLICTMGNNENKYIVVDLKESVVIEPIFDSLDDLFFKYQPQPDLIYKSKDLILKLKEN